MEFTWDLHTTCCKRVDCGADAQASKDTGVYVTNADTKNWGVSERAFGNARVKAALILTSYMGCVQMLWEQAKAETESYTTKWFHSLFESVPQLSVQSYVGVVLLTSVNSESNGGFLCVCVYMHPLQVLAIRQPWV